MVSPPEQRHDAVGRVSGRGAFRQFSRSTARARGGPVKVVKVRRPDVDGARVAFAISRRVGSAVVRNRLRRQLRAALGELRRAGDLPDGDYLVSVSNSAVGSSMTTLRGHLSTALARLGSDDVVVDRAESGR